LARLVVTLPRDPAAPPPAPPAPGLRPPLSEWDYVTTGRLVRDTHALCAALPADVDLVAAVPRSGLLPGSLVAYARHLPLVAVSRQRGVTDPGHGVRLDDAPRPAPRHVLLVDDTAANGGEMAACLPLVRAAYPDARVTRAVVYAHPRAAAGVDLFVSLYPGPHYLEWNWANAGHGAACGYDFDGILCRDFTPAEVATDDSYRAAMAAIEPLFLPRRVTVPLVVTARPESTRAITLEWLARHGVRVERLVMRDWEFDPGRDWNRQAAAFKARHYAASPVCLFAESDPAQAAAINEITGKAVLCPKSERVFPPSGNPCPDVEVAPTRNGKIRLALGVKHPSRKG
jgi:orotate phosphoribosyltransferase